MYQLLVEKFHEGGPLVMSGIAFTLVLSLAIIIERIISYWLKYDLSNSSGFMAAIQKMVMNNSIENAIRMCKKARPNLLPYVLAEGLKKANDSSEEVSNAVEHASLAVMPKVSKLIPTLGMMANVATLLGLLGTIFGLMKSFGAAAVATGAQKQTILSEGIAEALTATSFGLSTALFCIMAHGLLSIKQASILSDINHNAALLVDMLYTRKLKLEKK